MAKKILIVSRAFYPIIAPRSFRATELAKEYARQGNQVTVITHKRNFDYSEFENQNNVKIEDFTNGKWKEIKGDSFFKRATRYLVKYLFMYPDIQLTSMVKNSLKSKINYDLLISIAVPYPVHWGVALARDKYPKLSTVWVADCGDPFMGNKEDSFKRPFYFKYVENWFCRKAEYITVPIKEAIPAYPLFCRKKIKVIPQGFNFDDHVFFKNDGFNSDVTFGYAGALTKGIRDPSEFLEYLCTKQHIDFKFIVYTKNKDLIKPFLNKLKNKLEVRDYIPRNELLKNLSNMDFLVNIENRNSVQSPSKLIDYCIVNRPILAIKPFDINQQNIDDFLKRNYKNQYLIENIERYNIKNVANQFLELI